jgi:putative phosphoesterase
MKIAALYDIHGNLSALNAVLEELKAVQPDLIVVGGDIVTGPLPAQTLQRLLLLGAHAHCIRGNNDREVVTVFDNLPVIRRYLPDPSEQDLTVVRWIAGQLTPAERDFLAALPEQLTFQIEGLGEILFCHATPRSDEELFTPATSEERIKDIFSGVEQEIVVCGHTHLQFAQQVGKLNILNAGSVGMPFADRPGAYWLLLSPEGYELRRTEYDVQNAAQELNTSGNVFVREFVKDYILKTPTATERIELLERATKIYR